MLSLTRRVNESITLFTSDGEITISLTNFRSNTARIGIVAPKDVTILRTEIKDRKPDSILTMKQIKQSFRTSKLEARL